MHTRNRTASHIRLYKAHRRLTSPSLAHWFQVLHEAWFMTLHSCRLLPQQGMWRTVLVTWVPHLYLLVQPGQYSLSKQETLQVILCHNPKAQWIFGTANLHNNNNNNNNNNGGGGGGCDDNDSSSNQLFHFFPSSNTILHIIFHHKREVHWNHTASCK